MRQIAQNMRSGDLQVREVPAPVVRPGHVLVANLRSVISAGTEKMVLDLARKSLLGKARERPDLARRVLQKMRQEGVLPTVRSVLNRLDEPMPLGYASCGVVVAAGAGVEEFKPGDRVATNGPHAGVVCVPRHLCAHLPDGVEAEHGAFAVLGAIALQGVRLAKTTLGETAFVVGLGLLGQLAVALLKAAGCRVVATDLDAGRCELAVRMGAEVARPGLAASDVEALTGGRGADAVLVAAATDSKGPMDLASAAVRAKGRIVLLGVVGLELDRRAFYFKEAEFVVSCSYGPGRYDPEYEDHGHDYPFAHVRWTEQRNLQAVLDLMGDGRLDVSPLITHRFAIEEAQDAYTLVESGSEPHMGIVLAYEPDEETARASVPSAPTEAVEHPRVSCLGSGSFARAVTLPAVERIPGLTRRLLCSAGGLTAEQSGRKHGFEAVTADPEEVFEDAATDAVLVLTRHGLHAEQVARALEAGKHVFVEKPLALDEEGLERVEQALASEPARGRVLAVGFNRRFAPATDRVLEFLEGSEAPRTVHVRFNAGAIPAEHWTQHEMEGGGRIVGEACHAIDLAARLAGAPPVKVYAESVGGATAPEIRDDQAFITLRHANGSVSSVAYLAGGDSAFPKERVEVFAGGRVAVIDDWRSVLTVRGGKSNRRRLGAQDKGHRATLEAFFDAVKSGGDWPVPWEDVRAVSRASILAVRSLREGVPFDVV